MELVTLVPMIACIYAIYRWSTNVAFLAVVLPTLLLLPTYFWLTLQHLPSLNFIDCALLALGVGILLFDSSRWRFSRTDLWMLAFLFTTGYADYHVGKTTDAYFAWFAALLTGVVPYMAGKLLIEQTGSREKFCRTFIVLVAWGAVVSSYEYFFRSNPYRMFWNHFYPTEWTIWFTQVRWGFGRVSGPYSQSELAGIIVLTAWLLSLWIGRRNFEERERGIKPSTLLRHGKSYIWGLFVALFMTQARGPWIGALLGLAVAGIGRAKRPGVRSTVVLLSFLLVGVPAYVFGKDYLAGPRRNYGSEKETAQYRAQLIDNYIPLAKAGGPFGWGQSFPRIGGQDSIDNEYLFAWVTQGYIGMGALVLLIVESIGRLVVQAIRSRNVRDFHFQVTMLGIVVGFAFTISTVFLGSQTYELLFLLVGWAQAIHASRVDVRVIRNVKERGVSSETHAIQIWS